MATTWGTLQSEILTWVLDYPDFALGGAKNSYLIIWANRAVRQLHQEMDMFYKLQYTPASLTFTTSDYSLALPTDFFKKSDRFTYVKSGDTVIPVIGLDKLNEYDPNHDDTTTNTYPEYVAIEAGRLFVYPKFAGTIKIEGYFTTPTDMTTTSSNPDVSNSDDALAQEYIIAWVLSRLYRFIYEPDMEQYWMKELVGYLELYRLYLKQSDSKKENKMTSY